MQQNFIKKIKNGQEFHYWESRKAVFLYRYSCNYKIILLYLGKGIKMVIIPIMEKYTSFTKNERVIADIIMDNPEVVLSKSALEIADIAGVSSATVVRFSRKIGFAGFPEMKIGLVKYLSSDITLEKNLIISKGDSYKDCGAKLLSQINSICSNTVAQIDYVSFGKAVKALEKAENIYLFGVGASSVTAMDFQQKLVRINKRALYYSDSNIGIIATMTYKSGDLVVAISYSGETPVCRFVESVKQKGLPCIGITGNSHTTIARTVDIPLYTPSIERKIRIGPVSSRYSQQFICDMLFLSLVINHYEEAEELTRRASSLILKIT